ncbi:MAG: response regulator [Nitrospira sp.]|nr:response regulator [bacterium]MBL7048138.1 response regulator [Nitrospira sp.]
MAETVLFVDDEEYILSSLKRLFAPIGLNVLTASGASEAFEIIKREEIAVVISDNMMPGESGIDLLAKVKIATPDTQKILMTAYADLATAVDAINLCEVFRFITKPWDDEILINTVQEAVQRYQIIQSLQHNDESKLLSIAQAIELKDAYTRGHCERVANFALMLADELNMSEQEQIGIKHGCWLHDCGKIGVPEQILNKPGKLTDEEFTIIKKHPQWGIDIAQNARLSPVINNVILYHHEKYDGSGYPLGLKGNDIPIESRVAAIADVYDALTSNRAYRDKFTDEKTMSIMISMSKSSFDLELFDIFIYKCLKFTPEFITSITSALQNK